MNKEVKNPITIVIIIQFPVGFGECDYHKAPQAPV